MAFGEKIIPLRGVNTDLHETLMPPDLATFIKNLVYEVTDTADGNATRGSKTGVFKPCMGNSVYVEDFSLPAGYNQAIGTFSFRELKQVFVFIYNDQSNHTIYRINGSDQTIDIVYQGPCLNFQLEPQYFIAKGGCWLERTVVSDPVTDVSRTRTYLIYVDGFEGNCQRNICVEDSIATNSFDDNLFPYFKGDYDHCDLINMGVLTPSDCIGISEVPATVTSDVQNNKLLFNTWQFRLLYADVWGRPSEHGIISTLYIPAAGDCIASSSGLSRCLDLLFDAPPPYINSVQIEYRNCNSTQWYLSDTLELFDGSPLGDWWLRTRNPNVNYDPGSNKITYRFCADKGCDPIAPADTDRVFNPLPRTSQAVTAVGNFIALSNNRDGFLPFSQELKDQITFTVVPPTGQASTSNKFRNISILLEVFNFYNIQGPMAGNGGVFLFQGKYYFQALPLGGLPIVPSVQPGYQQVFKNVNQQGFIGYLAGTSSFTISEQYQLDSSGVFTKVTDFTKFDTTKKLFQKFTFTNVKAGIYVFRIAGLTVDPAIDTTSAIFRTSTNLVGAFPFNISNPSSPVNHNLAAQVSQSKELIVNVCDGDYDTVKDNKILVIADFTDSSVAVKAGYMLNTNDTTQDQIGIELLKVTGGNLNSFITDHNGYYFASGEVGSTGQGFAINNYGMCNCAVTDVGGQASGLQHQLTYVNFYLNIINSCPDYENQPCAFILVKGRVTLCGTPIGVPGVSVVLSRGRTAITDNNGDFTIIAHDDIISSPRQDNIYYISNTCPFTDCDGGCIQPVAVTIVRCTSCQPREVDVVTKELVYASARGLLSGGNYPVGLTGWDFRDRPGAVQQDPDYLLTIPSVQQTHIFAPSTVRIDIDPQAIFPDWVKYLTPWIGPESTIEEYITWIVDSVEFIDNTGLVNTAAPTQIKIGYASLIEYNKQNNFNTTVNWNFIPAGQTTPVTADKVEFLLNGDGTFFGKSITALVKYDTTGQSFLINYTDDLKGLLPNAIIRLVRPKLCTGTEPYFEVCFKIPVVNGKATITSFILDAFDTYYINRQIPVPTLQPNSSPPTFINEIRVFGVPFESSSPSDFWGLNCHNIGRVNTKNPYETVVYKPEQIALSGPLSPTGQLNFLNQFDDANKKDFSDTLINGITAVIPETSTILVLGQTDSFIVGFNDNIARVNAQGLVMAPSLANNFGQPERKVGSNYGCLLFDKNTIDKKEGIVMFLDSSKSVLVQHNYQIGFPLSNNGAEGLIRTKIKAVQQYNNANGNTRYFAGIINPVNHEYLLTDYIIRSGNFINMLRSFDPTVQETLAFDVFGKAFKGSYSFTPPYYGELEGEVNDQQLFSFPNGIPYKHYVSVGPVVYNTFYGQVVERVIEVVIVMDNLKKKKPLALAEYCKQGAYFVDRVLTETGQESRILLGYFLEAEFGWYAPFLCDLNTPADPNFPKQTGPNKLLDGNMLTGTWIKLRMIGDPAVNDQYSEFQGIAAAVFPSEKSGV